MSASGAYIEYTEEENESGYLQECVYVTCEESGDVTGPIWGHTENSVLRALATLTEECTCGATFHRE